MDDAELDGLLEMNAALYGNDAEEMPGWWTSEYRPIMQAYPTRLKVTAFTYRATDPDYPFGRVRFNEDPTEAEIAQMNLLPCPLPTVPLVDL